MSELTPAQEAFLSARDLRDNFGDMSADEIEALSFAAYAARTGRTLAVPPAPPAPPQAHPGDSPQVVADAPRPAPVEHPGNFSQLSMSEYAQLRGQLGVGRGRKEGRGIFDSVGSGSEAYTNAVRAQSGRTAWSNANVVEPPRLERYVRQDDHRDTRSVADRFSTPGNAFNI